jgi:hypothetical protein
MKTPGRNLTYVAIGAAILGTAGVYMNNERERGDAHAASPISLTSIPDRMADINQRRADQELAVKLETTIAAAKKSGQYPAGDIHRFEALNHKLSAPGPASVVKIDAVAVLDSMSHEASGGKSAPQNAVYRYKLYDSDGKASNYTLSCAHKLSEGKTPVSVTFATDLSRMRVERDAFVVSPAPYPGNFSFPGSGEAILSFTVLDQERAPSRLPR